MDATEEKEKVAGMSERGFRDHMVDRFRLMDEYLINLQKSIDENTALTRTNIASTADLVGIFNAAKMTGTAFAWTGRTLRKLWKITQPIIVTVLVIWVALGGKWPSWLKPPGN